MYRPTMGYRIGNHSRVHMKDFPVQINTECASFFLKIKRELTAALSNIASLSQEVPKKGRSTRKKNSISIQLHKDKPFFLSVRIYIVGCSVSWSIDINTKERNPDLKQEIIKLIQELRKEKGYIP